jgi:hypothetical protein
MANVKISELPAATSPVDPSDVLPIVQSSTTKKASISQLGFLQSGSTATARTIQDKLRDVISAKDYGVSGNGVDDDTTAITNLIAAAGAGATILFPAGMNCRVTSQILCNVAGQRFVGYGATITKDATFSGNCVIRLSAENVTWEGFTINGTDKADDGVIASAGLSDGMTIRNCVIYNMLYGISATDTSRVTVEGCRVYNVDRYCMRAHNNPATVTRSVTNIRVLNNNFDQSDQDPATSIQSVLLVRGDVNYFTKDVVIQGNRFIQCLDPANSAQLCCEMRFVDGGVFADNYGKDGAMLVSVACSSNVTVDSNVCDGATFYAIEVAGGDPALTFPGCFNVTVSNNTIHGRERLSYGVGLQGFVSSSGCIITGNTIEGTAAAAGGLAKAGIFVNEQWDNLVITGNRVDVTTSATGQYGIYLLATTTPITNVAISGNNLNGNSVGEKAIYLRSVQQATVSGNTCPDWTENGVYIDGTDATCDEITVTGNNFNGLAATAIGKTGTLGSYISTYSNPPYRRVGTVTCNDINLDLNVFEASGTGTPEGAVTAGVGSVFRRTDGGAGTCLYIKESGTGNTGWVAK